MTDIKKKNQIKSQCCQRYLLRCQVDDSRIVEIWIWNWSQRRDCFDYHQGRSNCSRHCSNDNCCHGYMWSRSCRQDQEVSNWFYFFIYYPFISLFLYLLSLYLFISLFIIPLSFYFFIYYSFISLFLYLLSLYLFISLLIGWFICSFIKPFCSFYLFD